MIRICNIFAVAQAAIDVCMPVNIENTNLDKQKMQGDWYTQSYFSLKPYEDISCRHLYFFHDKQNDQLWRISEAVIGDKQLIGEFEQTDLQQSWGTDLQPEYNIVLATDYETYYTSYWCDRDERNIWIYTRDPNPDPLFLDSLEMMSMQILPQFYTFVRIPSGLD